MKSVTNKLDNISIICRSDSTLRGHFPLELTTVEKTLAFDPDVRVFIPAFFEGNSLSNGIFIKGIEEKGHLFINVSVVLQCNVCRRIRYMFYTDIYFHKVLAQETAIPSG